MTRRAHEEGRQPPHRPRWFSVGADGDTGEWDVGCGPDAHRLRHCIERKRTYPVTEMEVWPDVDRIFIYDPETREVKGLKTKFYILFPADDGVVFD